MLTQLSNIVAIIIPLVVLPILLGTALFKDNFELPFHWWAGFLLISLATTIFHALKIDPAIYSIIITIFIIVLSVWQLQTLKKQFLRAKKLIQNIDFLVVIIITLVITISGLLEIFTHPLGVGGDAFSIWLNKAKSIYSGILYPALPIANYPSLVPTFNAFVMRFTGSYKPIYGLFIGPIAYCFWVLNLHDIFKRKSGWVMTATVSSIAILYFDDYVINGYQDKIIMMCASMSALAYLQIIKFGLSGNRAYTEKSQLLFWIGTFFAGVLSLIKNEGMVIGAILVGVSLLVIYSINPKQISTLLINKYAPIFTFITLAFLWPFILYTGNVDISKIQGDNLTLQSIFDIPRNIERIFIIWPYFTNYYRETFFMLILSICLSIISFLKATQLRKSLVYLWSIWFVHSIFIVFVFLSTRAPLIWHLDTAFNRLLSHHAFIYPLIILLIIAYLLECQEDYPNVKNHHGKGDI